MFTSRYINLFVSYIEYENTMKKMTSLTRESISDNVKVNNAGCSYPIRTVTSITPVVIKKPSGILPKTLPKKA